MVVFWITVPLMVAAVLFAAGIVLVSSRRQHRRLRTEEALVAGEEGRSGSGATRLAVPIQPQHAHRWRHALGRSRERTAHEGLFEGVETEVTPEEGTLHVVVPEDAAKDPAAAERIARELSSEDEFGEVRRLSS